MRKLAAPLVLPACWWTVDRRTREAEEDNIVQKEEKKMFKKDETMGQCLS